jgi:hypothetical protein
MHKNVEIVIGRLATDRKLQDRFAVEPREVLREQGLELSEVETAALAATDPRALRALSAALDSRLCKASRAIENEPEGNETEPTTKSESDSNKEMKR